MCGIVGIVRNSGSDVDRALLGRMCAAIRHRGPDEDGFYVNSGVGLGMRRLSIIDLKSGQQPIHNQDRTAWIVFNGEIYNYRELRDKLGEARSHLLYKQRYRSDHSRLRSIRRRLSQTFARACLPSRFGTSALRNFFWPAIEWARSRCSTRRLTGSLCLVRNSPHCCNTRGISKDIDFEALDHYLSFMCVPAPLTAYRAIRKLEPGHSLRWRKGEIKIERYWQPDFSKKLDISEQEAGEQAIKILRDAVKVRLMSEVPLGAFLSGGIDSSAVVALMSEESSEPVKTFSIGFEEQDFSELHHARRVAEHVGADHHEFIVRPDALEVLPMLVEHYGEPYADSSAVPTYYVARETRKHVTVALNGDGGDESFAGYERYAAMRLAERYHRIPAVLRESVVRQTIELMPSSETKRSRLRDLKRFIQAASLPKVERYLRWVSVFDSQAKQDLLTENFTRQTQGVLGPRACSSRGLRAPTDQALSMQRC